VDRFVHGRKFHKRFGPGRCAGAVLQQLLQNTSNVKVLQQLMTLDATYVSLNFDNPELKKIEPWAGTHKGSPTRWLCDF
jgi:hypothetical protein